MPLQPEQAEFLRAIYLPELRKEMTTTARVIEAMPADKGDYRPDAVSKSALELAWHIVATEMRFLDAVTNGVFDFTPRPRPESITNGTSLNAWYAAEFAPRVAALEKLSADQLRKDVDFRGMVQMPAVQFLGFVLRHSIHHRGQLSVYLRPMGAKVPAIYGESYDSAEARKAAQKGA